MTYLPLKLLYFVLLKKEHLRRLHLSSRCCLHHHHHWHRHGCHHHHHHHYQLKLTRWHLTLQSCCLPALQKLWEDKGKQKQANSLKVNNFQPTTCFFPAMQQLKLSNLLILKKTIVSWTKPLKVLSGSPTRLLLFQVRWGPCLFKVRLWLLPMQW